MAYNATSVRVAFVGLFDYPSAVRADAVSRTFGEPVFVNGEYLLVVPADAEQTATHRVEVVLRDVNKLSHLRLSRFPSEQ
jgi:hypothetical protein